MSFRGRCGRSGIWKQSYLLLEAKLAPLVALSLSQRRKLERKLSQRSSVAKPRHETLFLSKRAADVRWRFSGNRHLDQKRLGSLSRLKPFDDAAEAAFKKVGPTLLQP